MPNSDFNPGYFNTDYVGADFDSADYWGLSSAPIVAGAFWPTDYFGPAFFGADYWGPGTAPFVALMTNVDPTLFIALPNDDGDPSQPDIDPIQFIVTQ